MAGEAGFHCDRPHLIGGAAGWAHDVPFDGVAERLPAPHIAFQRKLKGAANAVMTKPGRAPR
jgi:hypothetical protein